MSVGYQMSELKILKVHSWLKLEIDASKAEVFISQIKKTIANNIKVMLAMIRTTICLRLQKSFAVCIARREIAPLNCCH